MKRLILITLLLSILGSCRILCATAECCHAQEWLGASEESHQQTPHPVNDDHCICNGGLQADDVGPILASLDPALSFLGIDLPLLAPLAILSPFDLPSAFLTVEDDLSARGSPPQVCALLQRYRL